MTSWIVLGRFFHGVVFFTLSLTVVFLQYRSRRILLAHHFDWLGVFAICEAIVVWNDLLSDLVPSATFLPVVVRPALLGMGYAFLLALGLQALVGEEARKARARRWLVGLNLLWLLPYSVALILAYPTWEPVTQVADPLIHYVLGCPGGVIMAIGLRRQSYRSLDAAWRNRIRLYLQLMEVMLGAFGVLHLLLVPAPALASGTSVSILRLPPTAAEWMWGIVGAGLTLGLLRALSSVQREIELWIEGVERLQALSADRERIGRDLHDGIIQSIYAAGLLLESLLPIIPSDPMRAQAQLGRVMDSLNETIRDIRRYIFDLRSDIPDEDLASGIGRLLRDFRINTLLETDFAVTGTPTQVLSMERRRHIFQIVREALANTARHAQAQWVEIDLHYGEEMLNLTISDDGIGMETLQVSKGYGLRNIRERARMLDGALRIESAPHEGVTFHLSVPY
jgi:signal transduction histidine kinase